MDCQVCFMMTDQSKTNKPISSNAKQSEPNNCMADFSKCEPEHSYVNITDMIRSLQRTQGFTDCFRRGLADCDQLDCAWRQYCLKNTEGLPPLK